MICHHDHGTPQANHLPRPTPNVKPHGPYFTSCFTPGCDAIVSHVVPHSFGPRGIRCDACRADHRRLAHARRFGVVVPLVIRLAVLLAGFAGAVVALCWAFA